MKVDHQFSTLLCRSKMITFLTPIAAIVYVVLAILKSLFSIITTLVLKLVFQPVVQLLFIVSGLIGTVISALWIVITRSFAGVFTVVLATLRVVVGVMNFTIGGIRTIYSVLNIFEMILSPTRTNMFKALNWTILDPATLLIFGLVTIVILLRINR